MAVYRFYPLQRKKKRRISKNFAFCCGDKRAFIFITQSLLLTADRTKLLIWPKPFGILAPVLDDNKFIFKTVGGQRIHIWGKKPVSNNVAFFCIYLCFILASFEIFRFLKIITEPCWLTSWFESQQRFWGWGWKGERKCRNKIYPTYFTINRQWITGADLVC